MGGHTTYEAESAPGSPEGAQSVLLCADVSVDTDGVCGGVLDVDDPSRTNYLSVTFDDSPDRLLDRWRRHVAPELPTRVGIVASGGVSRSTTADSGATASAARPGVDVATVPSPGDLTGLGVCISRFLGEWDGDGNRTLVCVDSLTTVLQYVETETAFRFLHTLLARCRSAGATVHAHITPDAHDERTVRTIESLFDAVADCDADGCRFR